MICEIWIFQQLLKYKVDGDIYDGDTESSEIYRCKYDKANDIFESYLEEKEVIRKDNKSYLVNPEKYNNFRNLANPKYF